MTQNMNDPKICIKSLLKDILNLGIIYCKKLYNKTYHKCAGKCANKAMKCTETKKRCVKCLTVGYTI